MMKKIFSVLLLMAAMLCVMTACGESEETGTPIEISYLNQSETQIIPEVHYLQETETKDRIVEVLSFLSDVPDSKELKPALSGGIYIVSYNYEDGQVMVSLSDKYKELSKTTEVLTRAALVRSLTNIPGVEYVMLTVNGEPLVDSSGTAIGIMKADMFLDGAGTPFNTYEQTTIRLYFANETGDGLVSINRNLLHNMDMSNVSMEKLVIEQLIKGPVNDSSYPTINPETKLLSVTVKDGICYVNLDSAFLTPVNNVTSEVVIYSIVNSLVELTNVNKVQISVDGNKDMKFREKYELSTVFERNLQIIE
ncbi:MAG: GerMN domain-containing protein [Lachnospiraceae bacterium]|nr:GerMN domain-containing protein [Lachnospiraceae bacterium]